MKEKFANISKRAWVRIVLATILFIIVAFSFAGEKVAKGNGIGWDGENYYTSMERFIPLIKHHGYDQYAIQRVMPWGLVDIFSVLTDIEISREIAIEFGIFFNAIAILLAIIFFFRISNHKQWKIGTEAIGFALLFFTYPILKNMGYYPVLSDTFGFTMGIMMCYYYFAEKKWALVVCGLVGTFIWPTTPIVAFALAFFPRQALPVANVEDTKESRVALQSLYVLFAIIPLLILALTIFQYDGQAMKAMHAICPLTVPMYVWMIPITCLCSCAYYYYIVSKFKVSLSDMLKENFTGKNNWVNYGLFVLFVLLTSIACRFIANSDPGALTTTQTLQCIALTSMTDPFVFVESHFIYFGIGYLLVLLLWRDTAKVIMQQGLGYLFIVAMWVLFSIRPEARVGMMYWVFALMALLMYLDTKNIRVSSIVMTIVFMLIHSRFWYPMNVPGIEKAFEWENYEHYVDFPAQRYFMSTGHWQSHEMFAIWMAVTIIVGCILYIGIRRKWFIEKQ